MMEARHTPFSFSPLGCLSAVFVKVAAPTGKDWQNGNDIFGTTPRHTQHPPYKGGVVV